MATELQETELQAFLRFVEQRIDNGLRDASPEESLRQFRAHREEIRQFVNETNAAVQQAKAGESRPLDTTALKARVRDRLRSEGITD